jgi:hypothetical protein
MRLFTEVINVIGAAFLQIAIALLIEELTFAGLVRLILAPRSDADKNKERKNEDRGENQCSH